MARRASTRDARLDALQSALGHRFADPALLTLALTHVSAARPGQTRLVSYQRLEFLGDRVLGVVIAELLYRRYPEAEEGELSQRLAALVRRETCAAVAQDWGVGPSLILGEGEVMSGGRRKLAILADACEALIGAVQVDGGYEAARAVVTRGFGDRIDRPLATMRDPKTVLQEWAQGLGHPTPVYREVGRTGPDHAPTFVVEVAIGAVGRIEGKGASKRIAEQDAASRYLAKAGLLNEDGEAAA